LSSSLYKGTNVHDTVGAMSNVDSSSKYNEFEMKPVESSTTPIAPGQFMTSIIAGGRLPRPGQVPNLAHVGINNSDEAFPFILLGGETINISKQPDEPSFTEIIFVMPDNRAICGKLYITNFRIFFKSSVSLKQRRIYFWLEYLRFYFDC
jgi:hypothetical protein